MSNLDNITLDDLMIEKERVEKSNSYCNEKRNIMIKNINKKIVKLCDHEIITDYIDTMFPYREGIMIQYCKYCELSKKIIDLNK